MVTCFRRREGRGLFSNSLQRHHDRHWPRLSQPNLPCMPSLLIDDACDMAHSPIATTLVHVRRSSKRIRDFDF